MRILHVVPSFYPSVYYGGPIYSVLQLCLNLSYLGNEIRVLTTDANGEHHLSPQEQADPCLESLQVSFCRRLGGGMIAPGLLTRLGQEAKWADLIHLTAVYNFSTFPTIFAARAVGKPLVWSPRGALQRWAGSRRTVPKALWDSTCKFALPRQTVLHVTSRQEALESARRVGNPSVRVIPNGIDVPPVPPDQTFGGVFRILFIGRLDPKKGLENLISSLPAFSAAETGEWRLQIVGEGPPAYVAGLRNLVAQCGIGANVEFSGDLRGNAKYSAFAQSDVVMIPSYSENFGNVVAEALAHARPVIVSRAMPWREVEQHDCGLWVDNDPLSLAFALRIIKARDRKEMGRRGRQWMIDAFSWHEKARCMLELYKDLVAA